MGRFQQKIGTIKPKQKKLPKPFRNRYLNQIRKTPKTLNQTTRKDLLKRIAEVMSRLWGNMPDWIMEREMTREKIFDAYKVWISEPFLKLYYEEYDDSEEM